LGKREGKSSGDNFKRSKRRLIDASHKRRRKKGQYPSPGQVKKR